MKRRIGVLLATAALANLGVFGASPAEAHTDVCAGDFVANLSTGFGLPGNWRSANYTVSLAVGACLSGSWLSAAGFVNGACGSSSGYGTTTTGHNFAFVSDADTLYVTGDVVGQFAVVEDLLDSRTCINKTATRFELLGEAVLIHSGCTIRVASTLKPGYNVFVCD